MVPWNKEESEAEGKRPTGRPQLRYKDVCKRDLKALGTYINRWETLAGFRTLSLETDSQQGLSGSEETLFEQAEAKRQTKRAQKQRDTPATDHIC